MMCKITLASAAQDKLTRFFFLELADKVCCNLGKSLLRYQFSQSLQVRCLQRVQELIAALFFSRIHVVLICLPVDRLYVKTGCSNGIYSIFSSHFVFRVRFAM